MLKTICCLMNVVQSETSKNQDLEEFDVSQSLDDLFSKLDMSVIDALDRCPDVSSIWQDFMELTLSVDDTVTSNASEQPSISSATQTSIDSLDSSQLSSKDGRNICCLCKHDSDHLRSQPFCMIT
jgi:hypothetical protein